MPCSYGSIGGYSSVIVSLSVCRAGAHVHALTLRSEDSEDLYRLRARIAEPVRDVAVEFRRLAGLEDEVLVAELQAQPAGQHVEPVVALVDFQVRFPSRPARRHDLFEGLQPART